MYTSLLCVLRTGPGPCSASFIPALLLHPCSPFHFCSAPDIQWHLPDQLPLHVRDPLPDAIRAPSFKHVWDLLSSWGSSSYAWHSESDSYFISMEERRKQSDSFHHSELEISLRWHLSLVLRDEDSRNPASTETTGYVFTGKTMNETNKQTKKTDKAKQSKAKRLGRLTLQQACVNVVAPLSCSG